jgi:hypothetical protein
MSLSLIFWLGLFALIHWFIGGAIETYRDERR